MVDVTSSDRTGLFFSEESVWNETYQGQQLSEVQALGVEGRTQIETVRSTVFRDNRGQNALLRKTSRTELQVDCELRTRQYDRFLAAAIGGMPKRLASLLGLVDIATDANINAFVSGGVTNWVDAGVVPGMWVRVAGFRNAANNGFFYVESVTMTVLTVFLSTPLVSESPRGSHSVLKVGFSACMIRDGNSASSFFFEHAHRDTSQFVHYSGMKIQSLSLSISAQSISKLSLGFVGTQQFLTSFSMASSVRPAQVRPVVDGSNNLTATLLGRSLDTAPARAFDMQIANITEHMYDIAQINPIAIRVGGLSISGHLELYFIDATAHNVFLNNSSTAFYLNFHDDTGDTLLITLPSVRFTEANNTRTSRNTDVFTHVLWEAALTLSTGYVLQFDVFPFHQFEYFIFASGAPPPSYFALKDQNGLVWYYWVDYGIQLTQSLTPFSLEDETVVALTTGTPPSWHQVTDQAAGTWYVYPDVLGQLVISSTPPGSGSGLITGLGLQLVGMNHQTFRVGARSTGEWTIEYLSGEALPAMWYHWFDEAGQLVRDEHIPTYFPGYNGSPLTFGTPPRSHRVTDELGGTWYLYPDSLGELLVTPSAPSGTALTTGLGISATGFSDLRYRLGVSSSGTWTITIIG